MPRPKVYDETHRCALLEAAARAIAAGGREALSLRAVAAEANTTTNAVYTLFGGRDGLLEAVGQQAALSFAQAQDAVPTTHDPLADLAGLGHAYREWALAHPYLYAVMFGANGVAAPPFTIEDPPCTIRALAATVQRLLDAGVFEDQPAMLITRSLWAGVHGMVSLEIARGTPSTAADREAYDRHGEALARGWMRGPGIAEPSWSPVACSTPVSPSRPLTGHMSARS